VSFSRTSFESNLLPFLHASSVADLVFWDLDMISRYENDSLRRICQKFSLDILRDTSTILVQGTATYPLPADTINVLHVYLDGFPLRPISTTALERRDPSYQTTQAQPASSTIPPAPRYWYTDKIGMNSIGLWPVPDAVANGKNLEIIYTHDVCGIDEAHTFVIVPLQRWVGDWLLLVVLKEAYSAETQGRQIDTAQNANVFIQQFEQAFEALWGGSQ
jgi:hypothetical protein